MIITLICIVTSATGWHGEFSLSYLFVFLPVCEQDNWTNYGWIFRKFGERVDYGSEKCPLILEG